MLSRLPISLAQLKAENNSEKLKNKNKTMIVFFVPFKKINQKNLQQFDQHYLNMKTIFMKTVRQ